MSLIIKVYYLEFIKNILLILCILEMKLVILFEILGKSKVFLNKLFYKLIN